MALDDLTHTHLEVQDKVFAYLGQWNVPKDRPIAVAFSGGGDSTALLSLLLKWTKSAQVYAFIIEHGLRAGSRDDAKRAYRRVREMGANPEILTRRWPDGIPTTGIQEKARNARYALLARACDDLKVEGLVLFMGHNQDDQAETVMMRQDAGSGWRGLAGISACAAYPTRPTISRVRVMRPLLLCRRSELRAYNRAHGLKWIEDPSNENPSFARIRARKYLEKNPREKERYLRTAAAARVTLVDEQKRLSAFIRETTEIYPWGGVALQPPFLNTQIGHAAQALKYILQAVGGQGAYLSEAKRINLARQLRAPDFTGATLGGVRFFPASGDIVCVRDLGALTGRHQKPPLAPLVLTEEGQEVWDGRYGVAAPHGASVQALANWQEHLSKPQCEALAYIPKPAWGGLPVFIRKGEIVFIPFLEDLNSEASEMGDFWALSLTAWRLYSLMGEFD